MGCDIHVHFEYKKNDEWINCDRFRFSPYLKSPQETVNTAKTESIFGNVLYNETVPYFRWYRAFGLLAGVRYVTTPIKEPCGLPDNMHWLTQEIWNKDREYAHTPTYYTLEELLKWRKKSKKKWKKISKGKKIIDDVCELPYVKTGDNEWDYFEKEYDMLDDIIINPAKEALKEYIYYFDDIKEHADEFRIIMWFDN